MSSLRDIYLEEAEDLFKRMEETLLLLEKSPKDASLIAEVFRSMHTLKGSSGMFGALKVADFVHNLETVYDKVRSNALSLTPAIIDCTFKSLDHLKKAVLDPELEDPDIALNHKTLTDEILTLLDKSGGGSGSLAQDVDSKVTYYITFQPQKTILNDGTNPLLLIDELADLGKAQVYPHINIKPTAKNFNPKQCYTSWTILLVTDADVDTIKDVFIFVEDDAKIEIKELFIGDLMYFDKFNSALPAVNYASKAITFKQLEKIIAVGDFYQEELMRKEKERTKTGEVEAAVDERLEEVVPEEEDLTEEETLVEEDVSKGIIPDLYKNKAKKLFDRGKSISSIRVPSDKLNELMNHVSELVTTQAGLSLYSESNFDPQLEVIAENVEKLTRQLRDIAFGMTLIQIDNLFGRFQRVIRDLSVQLGKSVDFVTEGGETELDKRIIESLSDPLLHIIRNSLDHGIETTKERVRKGKPEKGTIIFRAYYSGAKVYIQIQDDGKGLDPKKIRQKAIDQRLISKDEALTEKEIFDLVFIPGFSLAKNVTDISGRGVGMDVVKKNIQDIRGDISIESVFDKGTTITLGLPITLSVIDGLLVKVSDTSFIVPLAEIDKCFEVETASLNNDFNQLIVLDSEQIPFLDLRAEFAISAEGAPDITSVIVVSNRDTKIGVCVDAIIGEYQAVLKSVGKYYRHQEFISGATILGDGSMALVLDAYKIVARKSSKQKLAAS